MPSRQTLLLVMYGDGHMDFVSTHGISWSYDGEFWLKQVRSTPQPIRFIRARAAESPKFTAPLE